MKNKFILLFCMILVSLTFVSAESCVGISFEECVTYEGCSWIECSTFNYLQTTCENYSECSYEIIEGFMQTCNIFNEEQCSYYSSLGCSWNAFFGCDGAPFQVGYCSGTSSCYGEYTPLNTAPVLTNPITEDINLTVGETWTYDFDCTDVDNDTLVYFLLDNPPTSMVGTLNSSTGEISYTAIEGEIGSWQPTVNCYDGETGSNPNFINMNIIAEIPTTPQPSGSSSGLKMEQLPTDVQEPVTKISLFTGINNFFQNILNWFKGLFN